MTIELKLKDSERTKQDLNNSYHSRKMKLEKLQRNLKKKRKSNQLSNQKIKNYKNDYQKSKMS
jgi:hypothetical protein